MPGLDTTKDNVFLIWGGRSWVAGHLETLLRSQGRTVHMTTVRMEDRLAVQKELETVKPTHVFNCAGVTGRPNVDWCEDHRQETLTSNLVGTLNVATCCAAMGIHLTVFATGCERLFPNICHVRLHWLIGDRHLHVQ
jgi:3,5-epimerase/4-reductase